MKNNLKNNYNHTSNKNLKTAKILSLFYFFWFEGFVCEINL